MESSVSLSAEAPIDDLLSALNTHSRRIVLFHLAKNGHANVDELVDVIDEIDGNVTGSRDAIYQRLNHADVPRLVDYGLATVDASTGVVSLGDVPRDFEQWLDLAVRREIREGRESPTDVEASDLLTVLAVDDEPDFAEMVKTYLESDTDDIAVVTARTAPEAYAFLRSGAIDCVLSDYVMPAIDGLDLLAEVRTEHPDLAFILFTNKGDEVTSRRAAELGVTEYVTKGSDEATFMDLADRIREATAS